MNHILSLYAGKVAAFSRDDKRLEVRLDREAEGNISHLFLIHISLPFCWGSANLAIL